MKNIIGDIQLKLDEMDLDSDSDMSSDESIVGFESEDEDIEKRISTLELEIKILQKFETIIPILKSIVGRTRQLAFPRNGFEEALQNVREKMRHDSCESPTPKIDLANIKRLLVKVEDAKEFLEGINNFREKYNMRAIILLDDNTIVLCFETMLDCKRCQFELIKNLKTTKVIRERENDVEIVIETQQNYPREVWEADIQKITKEKPEILCIIKSLNETKWRAHFKLSSLALLKLQAKNESKVRIGEDKWQYKVAPEPNKYLDQDFSDNKY